MGKTVAWYEDIGREDSSRGPCPWWQDVLRSLVFYGSEAQKDIAMGINGRSEWRRWMRFLMAHLSEIPSEGRRWLREEIKSALAEVTRLPPKYGALYDAGRSLYFTNTQIYYLEGGVKKTHLVDAVLERLTD